jgi:hypothetical protein
MSEPQSPRTPYEQQRLENIERNRALLQNLGLENSLLHKEKSKKTVKRKALESPGEKRRNPRRGIEPFDKKFIEPEIHESPTRFKRVFEKVFREDLEDNQVRYCPRHLVIHDVSMGICRSSPCAIANRYKTFPRDVSGCS